VKRSGLDAEPRLVKLTGICLALPGAARELLADHAIFRAHGKPFAYFLADHDKDGITSVCCRAAGGENEDRARREPLRFYLPRYIGKRGWFGLRLDLGRIDWREVRELVTASHALTDAKTGSRNSRAGRTPAL
jgi:predicted DNA-binding protein (MmcQ/YjbR family)